MKRVYIRSIIYNICFYGLTFLACVLCLPALLLPRRVAMGVVYGFVHINAFLERVILNLRYEVRGAEHLPKSGAYIVAAKHQSAYETLKLHILFDNPAVILKKELLSIPLWGQYLAKTDVIAIDRSSREAATKSIQDGALRVKAQGRPILIFPQGTRVAVDDTPQNKPYKIGVARMQEATDLPIIPMAMNAGVFWPRNGFWKSSGTVVFEFLSPIEAGQPKDKVIKQIEETVETASIALMNEAREASLAKRKKPFWVVTFGVVLALLFTAYSLYWFEIAKGVKREYAAQLSAAYGDDAQSGAPVISGYPFKMHVSVDHLRISNSANDVEASNLSATAWPFPNARITIQSGALQYRMVGWGDALAFDSLDAVISVHGDILHVYSSELKQGDFIGSVVGVIDFAQKPFPKLDIVLNMIQGERLMAQLADLGVVNGQTALLLGTGVRSMADPETGIISLPIHQRGEMLMAGPLPVMRLPIHQHSTPKRQKPIIPSE